MWVDLWASLYDDESKSAELLHEMHDTYYLVAVVDNDFIDGNLWEVRMLWLSGWYPIKYPRRNSRPCSVFACL